MTAAQKRASVFDIARKPRRESMPVDIAGLRVESNVPYPAHRAHISGKYDALFERMKPGDSIPCERGIREHICNAMRKWIARKGKADVWCPRSIKAGEDGRARVWLMKR